MTTYIPEPMDNPNDLGPLALVSSDVLGPLLDDWAEAACVRFVNRSYGQSTTDTVSRDDLLQLMRAVQAAECERWSALAQAVDYGTAHGWPLETLTRLAAIRTAMVAREPNS